jgi:pteridine reductase
MSLPADHSLAVVTGAGHRLGRAIALGLAQKGFAIGLHYHHSESAARQTAAEIEALGVPVLLLRADLADETQIAAVFQQTAGSGWPLRVLVNSAAVMARGDLRAMSAADWDATMALNLRAPWLCAREAARQMGAGSVIINITDTGSAKVWTGYPAYVISKSALETLTRLLARTLAPDVRVNAVAPGLVVKSEGASEEEWQRLIGRLPLKQAGSTDAVVRAVLFLLENNYITGDTLVVDGGYRLI